MRLKQWTVWNYSDYCNPGFQQLLIAGIPLSAFFWTDGYSTLLEAQLQSELQIAWAESAPSLSEFRAIQFIVAARTVDCA